ncbi:MAG: threonine synthase [Cellulosilyticaceae bacterium]
MRYYTSTRKKGQKLTAAQAVLQGISQDGGLFVPTSMPQIDFKLEDLMPLSYKEIAYRVMRLFFDDLTEEELKSCIDKAYDSKFDDEAIAPLVCTQKTQFLELFHGPTLAFKDMALTILPYLMLASKAKEKEDKEIVILTATSGDTGKAALEGFAGVEETKIIVFFPENGVSDVQKRQMVTQVGDNTLVVGIEGNFDDAQTGVKQIFGDKAFNDYIGEKGYKFSSANSINIGRLTPQVVYYFHAYIQMVKLGKLELGDTMNVAVPTGNFGNILAAYYAKEMGLPISQLICASNKNKVLFDFFKEGVYDRNREFHITNSPSMDILISSNLERLLYHLSGERTDLVNGMMEELKETGKYSVTEVMKEQMRAFYGGYVEDEGTQTYIKQVYEEESYLMDTHTAVAYAVYDQYVKETRDETPTVIISTASPYKFTGSVMGSLDERYKEKEDVKLLEEMEKLLGEPMPLGVKNLFEKEIKHKNKCKINEMKKVIENFLD